MVTRTFHSMLEKATILVCTIFFKFKLYVLYRPIKTLVNNLFTSYAIVYRTKLFIYYISYYVRCCLLKELKSYGINRMLFVCRKIYKPDLNHRLTYCKLFVLN